jgi:hypothetical protein
MTLAWVKASATVAVGAVLMHPETPPVVRKIAAKLVAKSLVKGNR